MRWLIEKEIVKESESGTWRLYPKEHFTFAAETEWTEIVNKNTVGVILPSGHFAKQATLSASLLISSLANKLSH